MTGPHDEGGINGGGSSFHWDKDEQSSSGAIVEALAEFQGTAPLELDPLYNAIDPVALDQLLSRDDETEVDVEFRKGDYLITVSNDGEIRIQDVDDPGK